MSRAFDVVALLAKLLAMTAAALESSAARKYFSSSTKTRSPADAECKLATPVTMTWSLPIVVAPIARAISPTLGMALVLYVCRGKGKRRVEDCKEAVLS